jgi:ATP-binding cassette subfamily F protein 3
MIVLRGISKGFSGKVLYRDLNFHLSEGERVGLVGPNGSGKSTLLKIIAGEASIDSGSLIVPKGKRIGYLPQDGLRYRGGGLYEEALSVFDEVLRLRREAEALRESLEHPGTGQAEAGMLVGRLAELEHEFELRDGFSIDRKIGRVLGGLGFPEKDFPRPVDEFSGGWQMRIALAKLLLTTPDVLLLDEPTNYLDLEARNWLLTYLREYPHAVVIVSHDRHLLDATVSRIAELSRNRIEMYHCNYTGYVKERVERTERLLSELRRQEEKVEKIRRFIDRNRYRKDRARQVQSRLKMLERMPVLERPPGEKQIHFRFPAPPRSGRIVIELKGAAKRYGSMELFGGIDFLAERGERIAVVGPNGAGKSTLLRILAGKEALSGGERLPGHNAALGYFAQDEAEKLRPGRSVLDELGEGAPLEMMGSLRAILGGFLFSGDDVEKDVGVLSGGEKNRLALAKLLLRPTNLLLLDEPTNHLDIESVEVLLRALRSYEGTIVFVSHDRYFINMLADRVAAIEEGKIFVYPGNYEDFLRSRPEPGRGGDRDSGPPGYLDGARKPSCTPAEAERKKASREEWERMKKERGTERALKKKREARDKEIEAVEAKITALEETIGRLETAMADPQLYCDAERSRKTVLDHKKLAGELEALNNTWRKLVEGEE